MALLKLAKLTANGTAISGHNSVNEIGGVDVSNAIEITQFSLGSSSYAKDGSTHSSAHRRQDPLRLVTRLDQALPLLQQAAAENHTIDGTLHLFHKEPSGPTRNYFNITVQGARIVALEVIDPDPHGSQVATVTIELLANTVIYEDLIGSRSYEDRWNAVV